MWTRRMGRGFLLGPGIVAAVLLGACAEETTGGESEADGGGTEEVSRHLGLLDEAYAAGSTTEVESHLGALEDSWDDAESEVSESDAVQELLDSLETQISDDAPPEEVSATVEDINQALG